MKSDSKDATNGLTLAEAATVLGSTPLNILMHIKRGVLCGVETAGEWRVDPDSIAALLERRREGSAPAVCQSGCGGKTDGCGSCG